MANRSKTDETTTVKGTEGLSTETLLAASAESSDDAIYGKTLEGNLLSWNHGAERMYGYSAAEMVGRPVSVLVPSLRADEIPEILERLKRGERVDHFETVRVRKNGETFDVSLNVSPVRDASGKIIAASTVARDITERKRAEAVLVQERHLFYTLMDNLPDLIYFKDCESRFTRLNTALAKLFGLSDPAQAVGKTDFDFFAAGQAKEFHNDEEKIIRTGQPMLGKEEKLTWPDGQVTWSSTTKMPLRDDKANIIGTFGVSRDITDRKQAEARIKESEEKFRKAFMTGADAFYIGTLHEGLILEVNDRFEEVFGYSREEVIGKTSIQLELYADAADRARMISEVESTGYVRNMELRARRNGGEIFPLLISVNLLQESGEKLILGVIRDITERERAEEALRQNEAELKEALLAAQMGVWEWTAGTDAVIWDENLYRIAGRDPKLPVPTYMQHKQFYAPESWERLKAAVENSLATGTPYELDLEMVRPDGSKRWVIARGVPLRDANGRITRRRGTVQDITERKRAAEALRASEARFRTMMERAPVAISISRSGLTLSVNQKYLELYGFQSVDEVMGRSIVEQWSPASRAMIEERVRQRALGLPVSARFEGVGQRKDGSQFPVEVAVAMVDLPDGPASVGFLTDITDRKRAEEALRESEEKYRSLVSNIPDVAWTVDAELHFVFISENIERVSGFSPDEVYQQGIRLYLDSVHPDDIHKVREGFRALFTEGRPFDVECRAKRKDGEWIWVHDRAHATYEKNGIRYADGLLSDITERKRVEEKLRLTQFSVEHASDAIFWMDPNGQIVYVNDAACRSLGRSREDLLSLSIPEIDPLVPKEVWGTFWEEVKRRGSMTFETQHQTRKGKAFPVEVTANCVKFGGKEYSFAFAREITERKQAEQELRDAKEAAEAASRAKSEFLAVMSHEIRTPMNGIIGMTELALDTALSNEQREYLTMVKESAGTLLTLINDILDFSKIEAGKLSLDVGEFDLQDTLSNTMRALAHRADQKGLELTWETLPDLPARLVGDPGRLRQILVNLVGNAIKFTERGEVGVRVETESQGEDWAALDFCVTDTGIGIPREKQELIFEPFVQADNSTTRKYGGTGLGLAIATRLVNLMEGRIWVESEPNNGSRFHFTAKFGLVKEPQAQTDPLAKVNLQGTPVLVIDDNATNRRILEAMLKGWSMQPTLVESGQEGLAAMRRAKDMAKPFALILLDARMPSMDGFMVVEEIKQDATLTGSAVLMLTSAGQRGDAARCRELGVSGYLVKPIRQSELLEAILLVLGQSSQRKDHPDLVTRHTIRAARRKVHILVAEDNAVNRELVTRLLQKHGHTVMAVATGREAVELLDRDAVNYDIVLMDVEMPGMDGFQATDIIREKEKVSGKHVPIIALTADAMKGDRERCLAAGMGGYVSKPIRHEDLFETIQALVLDVPDIPSHAPVDKPPVEILDEALLVSRVDNDPQLLRDLVDLFLEECPRLVDEIRAALDRKDAKAVERGAHSLKGCTSNLAAQMASEAALKLERLARAEDLVDAESVLQELEYQLERLKPALLAAQEETERRPF